MTASKKVCNYRFNEVIEWDKHFNLLERLDFIVSMLYSALFLPLSFSSVILLP